MRVNSRLIIPREQDIILDSDMAVELTTRLDARNAAIVEHLGKYALANPDRLYPNGHPDVMVPVSEQCQGAIIDLLEVVDTPVPRGETLHAIEDHWQNGENSAKWPDTAYSLTQSGMLSIAMMALEAEGTVRRIYPEYAVELVREQVS
jgi:hypothetical protein